ncbi:hypothetical protein VC83_07507 [Pseudogymnoascus destructans]|uniref:STB6-like N-terminal domain-containing protein n=2 Tax=Pseudogymnoascus destructans TaxID=655981 RepID=L8G2A2_PSED2|nr:uncharacterized protein VC83_07507 [Pseudogymnoascus destructans]ELR07395.1 hypothetical protein GMDG_02530 [Pseudogymnoascus destructans 20631-21]OAF56195.1 hypothetical protein VC83_07507 [Pseudogymnoascus destructans]
MAPSSFLQSDARLHREEDWTLSGTSSVQASSSKSPGPASLDGNATYGTPETNTHQSGSTASHRRFVFTDPIAFRYLEDDSATVVLERRGGLKGYQLYLVEQWACSRVHPTFLITTFTGDPTHTVLVGVLGVPANEEVWSPRLRVYFKAVSQFHARLKDTTLGMLMVTNLSGFPSALTVIPVPDGDIKSHREDFIVNENLKRLGCSGRSGLSLAQPVAATQAKFHQLYKTSDRIDLYSAVIELVKLCQVALMMFGKLEQEYADGLLCDVTERAINDWWTEFGSEYYNIEPADGILGPTTVAALIGMLMGARNRLNYCGAPVAKDAFDITSLKRGIASFQKSQKLERTRRLDRQTLACLRRCTAKAAAGEGWAVPKAVKSTVVELSGKGGEMMMGMVGARDKAGIGDIETLDIDQLVSLVHGDRSKWLWYGKQKRSGTGDNFGKSLPENGNMVFSRDTSGGYVWSNRKNEPTPVEDDDELRREKTANTIYPVRSPGSAVSLSEPPNERDPQIRKTVFKSVTGKMNDARSGFGRIKDAVGLRGHASRHSKDEGIEGEGSYYLTPGTANFDPNTGSSATPGNMGKAFSWKAKPEEYQGGYRKDQYPPLTTTPSAIPRESARVRDSESPPSDNKANIQQGSDTSQADKLPSRVEKKVTPPVKPGIVNGDVATAEPSVNGSANGNADLDEPPRDTQRGPDNMFLYRRRSVANVESVYEQTQNEARWPRHLSFSDVSEAVLKWQDISAPAGRTEYTFGPRYVAKDENRLHDRVLELHINVSEWVKSKVASIEALEAQAMEDQEEFQKLYYELSENYHNIQESSQDLLAEERARLVEGTNKIEVLDAKLEYEINALVSKVADVEDGVAQFETQVDNLESHATELEQLLQTEGWLHWAVRTFTGIGIGPHTVDA